MYTLPLFFENVLITSLSLYNAVLLVWDQSTVHIKKTTLECFCVQIKAVLNCYYKVFKDEPVLIFNSRENIQFYWNRLRQLLHFEVPEPSKEPEATLPPVGCPC